MAVVSRQRCAMPSPADPGVTITIQAEVPLTNGIDADALTSLIAHILREEGVEGPWEMGIRFVDDGTMQAAHAEYMDIDEPTDIMTFPYADQDDAFPGAMPDGWDDTVQGGDLIISVDTAEENARAAGWSLEDELRFLVAHGVLHLLGWDDPTEQERAAMLGRQTELLSSWSASR